MDFVDAAQARDVDDQTICVFSDSADASFYLADCTCAHDGTACYMHATIRQDYDAFRDSKRRTVRSKRPSSTTRHQHKPLKKPAVQRKISSQTSWLASWLVRAIEDLQFQFTWIVLGPSILGQDMCFGEYPLSVKDPSECRLILCQRYCRHGLLPGQ